MQQIPLEARRVIAGKLHNQQTVWLAACDVCQCALEQGVIRAQRQHVVIHQLNRNGTKRHDVSCCFHRSAKAWKMTHTHDTVEGQA